MRAKSRGERAVTAGAGSQAHTNARVLLVMGCRHTGQAATRSLHALRQSGCRRPSVQAPAQLLLERAPPPRTERSPADQVPAVEEGVPRRLHAHQAGRLRGGGAHLAARRLDAPLSQDVPAWVVEGSRRAAATRTACGPPWALRLFQVPQAPAGPHLRRGTDASSSCTRPSRAPRSSCLQGGLKAVSHAGSPADLWK